MICQDDVFAVSTLSHCQLAVSRSTVALQGLSLDATGYDFDLANGDGQIRWCVNELSIF